MQEEQYGNETQAAAFAVDIVLSLFLSLSLSSPCKALERVLYCCCV